MTKTRFDYKAACADVALPIARRLASGTRTEQNCLNLYRELRDSPAWDKLAQGQDLNVPMPECLITRFAEIPAGILALAARAINSAGHWGGSIDESTVDKRGAHWKFSNLADQVLARRLHLPTRGTPHGNGYSYQVHEGVLRVCASSPDSWTWIEVGPATPETLQTAREWVYTLVQPPAPRSLRRAWEAFERCAYEAMRARPERFQLSEQWTALLDAGRNYMREEGKCSDDCPECGTSQLWRKGSPANHKRECIHYPIVPALAASARDALSELAKECERRGIDPGPAMLAAQSLDFYTAKTP